MKGDWYEDLERWNTEGAIEEFLDWLDTDNGKDWLSPMHDNWLIRRDTVRQAAFNVMRRSVGREIKG